MSTTFQTRVLLQGCCFPWNSYLATHRLQCYKMEVMFLEQLLLARNVYRRSLRFHNMSAAFDHHLHLTGGHCDWCSLYHLGDLYTDPPLHLIINFRWACRIQVWAPVPSGGSEWRAWESSSPSLVVNSSLKATHCRAGRVPLLEGVGVYGQRPLKALHLFPGSLQIVVTTQHRA